MPIVAVPTNPEVLAPAQIIKISVKMGSIKTKKTKSQKKKIMKIIIIIAIMNRAKTRTIHSQ